MRAHTVIFVDWECYASSARIATRALTARYDEALQPAGVSLAQFSLLRRLARLERASLTTLAADARLDRSTAGRNVRVLEKHGFVERTRGEDQREQIFTLTAAGREVMAHAYPLWRAAQQSLEADLGEERAGHLRALLHAVS